MSIDFINKWKEKPCNNGSKSNYLICPITSGDFLHVLYPPLNEPQVERLFNEIIKIKNPPGNAMHSYKIFLMSSNGAELYGGSVVIFGYADEKILGNEEGHPASILKENVMDKVSKVSKQVLYIGNAVFSSKQNIHFYLNLVNGLIVGSIGGNIEIQWPNFDAFLESICKLYDSEYSTETGRHLFYNQREKGIINNIQFFKLNNL